MKAIVQSSDISLKDKNELSGRKSSGSVLKDDQQKNQDPATSSYDDMLRSVKFYLSGTEEDDR